MNALRELWDWRRRVADLYAGIRRNPDPVAAWHDWRSVRDALFRSHPQTPLDDAARSAFRGIDYFPYDPALRLTARLLPIAAAEPLDFAGGADGTIIMHPFALTAGLADRLGRELTLYWVTGYGGGVFLPYTDRTSGAETYPGGRYLLDSIKGADLGCDAQGDVVLDFNFSYYPSCAYSPRWVCPLTPPANRLPGRVPVGERNAIASAATAAD